MIDSQPYNNRNNGSTGHSRKRRRSLKRQRRKRGARRKKREERDRERDRRRGATQVVSYIQNSMMPVRPGAPRLRDEYPRGFLLSLFPIPPSAFSSSCIHLLISDIPPLSPSPRLFYRQRHAQCRTARSPWYVLSPPCSCPSLHPNRERFYSPFPLGSATLRQKDLITCGTRGFVPSRQVAARCEVCVRRTSKTGTGKIA